MLVADDGESNRQLISLILTRAGIRVESATNGLEAAEMAEAESFDLILMDMQMPVMDGYSAVARLRQGGTDPIVALTGNAMKGEEQKCRAAGCSAFLPKPVEIEALMSCLRKQLRDGSRCPANRGGLPRATFRLRLRATLKSSLPMDDPDFREIVAGFVLRLAEQIEVMRSVHQSGDLEQLAGLAHWLKGEAGTMGFHAFTEPALRLEQMAQRGNSADLDKALQAVVALASRVTADDAPPE